MHTPETTNPDSTMAPERARIPDDVKAEARSLLIAIQKCELLVSQGRKWGLQIGATQRLVDFWLTDVSDVEADRATRTTANLALIAKSTKQRKRA